MEGVEEARHTDRDHVHAHFIIGNCNRDTGKAFRRNEKDLYTMSEFFGEQCVKRGLTRSVRKDYYSKNPWQISESFNEVQMQKKGKESFKSELREAIEKECRDVRNQTFEDVVKALWEHYHVETRVKGNTISYRHPEYKNKAGELVSCVAASWEKPILKEELRMSLKNYGEEEQNAQPTAEECLSDMSEQMKLLAYMKKAQTEEARDSKEVAILLTSVENLFLIQQSFFRSMLTKFDELNKNQLKLLSVQGEYEKSVRDSTAKTVHQIYNTYASEQEQAFKEIRHFLENDTDEMIKKINNAAKGAKKAADNAANTAFNIELAEKWRVRLFYLPPFFVVLDIIIRLYLRFWS